MSWFFLAAGPEWLLLAAGLAVALLLFLQVRIQQRFRAIDDEVQRLKRAHRDGTLDARSRLEEASKALESLEESVMPKLASLEPHLADVGSRLDELEERVAALVPALEAAGRRETEASEVLSDARTRLERTEEVARDVGEKLGVLEEGLRDARDRLQTAERGLDHLRTSVDERVEAIESRLSETIVVGTPTARERGPRTVAPEEPTDEAPSGDDEDEEAPDAPLSHEEDERGEEAHGNPTMAGVVILVVALALLAAILHWIGVGR